MESSPSIAIDAAGPQTVRRLSGSHGPDTLSLDPDLPISTPSNGGYWGADDQQSTTTASEVGAATEDDPDDPTHLFWVPAHLHPELAPASFRAFLKEHANSDNGGAAPADDLPPSIARSLSGRSSLGRKKSMLSRQYRPSVNDNVENEKVDVMPVRRNRSSIYSNSGPQLTMGDLQKLEHLAEEAAKSDDPARLRSVLRRSFSLNVSPSVIDQMDDISETDDADEPIIVPRPGQILQRSARTKIRKVGLQGDGNGHRFAATRRGKQTAAAPDIFPPSPSSSTSESDHSSDIYPLPIVTTIDPPEKDANGWDRPMSFSEESAIYDSYADRRDSASSQTDDDDISSAYMYSAASPPPSLNSKSTIPVIEAPPPPPHSNYPVETISEPVPVAPILHHPTPQRQLSVPLTQGSGPSRSPSPGASSVESTPVRPRPAEAPSFLSTSPSPTAKSRKEKEKEKKGGLFGKSKWGAEKNDGKVKKEKPKPGSKGAAEKAAEEKDSGFFGSLFGGKKKHEEPANSVTSGAGHAAAAALLGASKSKSTLISPSHSPAPGGSYSRYPIHVERAVYRLSHIKLANPRRPLYEQVLISNLMFWYLGVINKAQNTPNPAAVQAAKEEKERQEKERVEKERLEKEREKEVKRESGRKGALTKAGAMNGPGGAGGSGRRAEMPVKGPQYGMGMVMEQEAAYDPQSSRRPGSTPPANGYVDSGSYGRSSPSHQDQQDQPYYYADPNQAPTYIAYTPEQQPPRSNARSPPTPSLPTGAMPPVSSDHSWLASQASQPQQPSVSPQPYASSDPGHDHSPSSPRDREHNARPATSPPSPQLRQRSPSYTAGSGSNDRTSNDGHGQKPQVRSLSASAVAPKPTPTRARSPPPPSSHPTRNRSKSRSGGIPPTPPPPLPNGIRTVRPGSAGTDSTREEDDLPLSAWQQQKRQHQPPLVQQDRYSRR